MRSNPFKVDGHEGEARATTLSLARGEVRTPLFMPVGTQGAVRGVHPQQLAETGAQIVLANTYHLHQRPGEELIAKHGGLHGFMGTELPILTDSGGFQVFSLEKDVSEEGVRFRYEIDGRATVLTPERSMDIQQQLGSDIAMVFDECVAYGESYDYVAASVDRTTRWERRSKEAHTRPDQSLFGIVQGGFWPDLRQRSAEAITEIGFDGYAIGGLSVGEGHGKMCEVLDMTTPHMPWEAPRYLMGVGRPLDLIEGVARGIDMFDCVIQTRHARSGVVWTWHGRMRLGDRRYRGDLRPLDDRCTCTTCATFSRAYLHHLFKVNEILAATLASIHNIAWFQLLMTEARERILAGTFQAFRGEIRDLYPEGAPEEPEGEGMGKSREGRPPPRPKARHRR